MPDLEQPSAPAQPDADTTTAVDQAVASNDVASFRAARAAERSGTPLDVKPEPIPEPKAPAPKAEDAPREISKRQQQINDYERRLAEKDAELARYRTAAPVEKPKPEPKAPAPDAFPEWDEYSAQHPEHSYDTYRDAREDFRLDQRDRARQADTQRTQRKQDGQAKTTSFVQRVEEHVKANPGYFDRIDPQLVSLKPSWELAEGEPFTPLTAMADQIVTSEIAPLVLQHFSDHPEDFSRFTSLPPAELFKQFGKLEAALERTVTVEKPPTPLTKMPRPSTTLGTKPTEPGDRLDEAVSAGDVGAFRAERLRQRTAEMR